MFLGYIFILYLPFFILLMFGFVRQFFYAIAAGLASLVIAVGFFFGLLIEAMFLPNRNWKAVTLPELWTNEYAEKANSLGEMLLIPHIFFVDLLRMYFHYMVNHATVIPWITLAWSCYIIWKFVPTDYSYK